MKRAVLLLRICGFGFLCLGTPGWVGCKTTMAQDEYYRLAEQVSEANERSFQVAMAGLEQRGIRLAPELGRWTYPGQEARQLCLAMERARYFASVELPDELPERTVLYVGESSQDGIPAPQPVEVSAPLLAICDFFTGTQNNLEVEFADNIKQTLVRIEQGWFAASNAEGRLMLVRPQRQPVSVRRVVVEQECNEMPQPELHPLESGHAIRQVYWSPGYPVESIDMEFDVNELDVVCTDYVY